MVIDDAEIVIAKSESEEVLLCIEGYAVGRMSELPMWAQAYILYLQRQVNESTEQAEEFKRWGFA